MPQKPKKICSRCRRNTTRNRVCDECEKQGRKRLPDNRRPNSRQRGYTWRWQKFRETFLADHPLCAECERQGRVTAATVVDHVIPHKGDMAKFWEGPFQAMCVSCHNRKIAKGL